MIPDFLTLFHAVLSILIPVLIGYGAIKAKIIGDETAHALSTIVLKICNPFLLLTSVLGIEYSNENLRSGLLVLLLSLIVHAAGALLAFLATCRLKDQRVRRVCELEMVFANCGFFGFPLLKVVYGDIGLFWGGFYCIVFNILLWSYGVFVLSRANREFKIRLTKIFINGGTVPCILGLSLYFLRIPVYPPVLESLKTIGSVCTPLSMLFIGTMIAKIPLKRLVMTPMTYYVAFVKLIMMPLGAAVLLKLLGFSLEFATFGALMASLPTAAATAMFAETYDIEPVFASQNVGVNTLITLLTIPLIMQLVHWILPYIG